MKLDTLTYWIMFIISGVIMGPYMKMPTHNPVDWFFVFIGVQVVLLITSVLLYGVYKCCVNK